MVSATQRMDADAQETVASGRRPEGAVWIILGAGCEEDKRDE